MISDNDTICAVSTPPGTGAIAMIRVSGKNAFSAGDRIFKSKLKTRKLKDEIGHSLIYGTIIDKNEIIDEVVIGIYKSPGSYTGEDMIEINCHGSMYIQQRILELLFKEGIRMADAGEFTMRAFTNGKFDLSQAEAVADLIASNSKSSHDLAIQQMRGGYSQKMKELRQQLLDFTSLIELELDFSEEDVEFADRKQLLDLLSSIKKEIETLTESFSLGNVLKKGIPVAIIGRPNVGKSTLLNAILNEERAIVSEIPGTTRDVIEDTIVIDGISFRFIDTAGLRESGDQIESIGIERTKEKIKQASIILYLCDLSSCSPDDLEEMLSDFKEHLQDENKRFILIGNKIDMLMETPQRFKDLVELETIFVSAKRKENIHLITESLVKSVKDFNLKDSTIVSNARHYEALTKALEAILNVEKGIKDGIPSDLFTIDIRQALYHLGSITGEISTDEILGNIFGKFCIGK
jgi:tRNA modification GTPase